MIFGKAKYSWMTAQEIKHPLWFVARKPLLSFDTEVHRPLKAIGSLIYQGLDRMAWNDIETLYYNKKLPPDLVALWETLFKVPGATNIVGATERSDAYRLLHASKEVGSQNEILCALSPGNLLGEVENLDWLGYDPLYITGGPSTLLEEVYRFSDSPLSSYVTKLNKHGLFDLVTEALEFGNSYRELSSLQEELVESLPLFDQAFRVLSIGRARLESMQSGGEVNSYGGETGIDVFNRNKEASISTDPI